MLGALAAGAAAFVAADLGLAIYQAVIIGLVVAVIANK